MAGNAATVVVEVAGYRHSIGLDKGHKLEIRSAGGSVVLIENRPVTEFSAAVDRDGRLHVAAWLLSRHLMYYTTADGVVFTKSTLLKSDGGLRLKNCLVFADSGVSIAYVAETEYANTLVCYRFDGGDWEGRRVVEVDLPQRLTAWQFDGSPGAASILYGVRESGRTVMMSRPLLGEMAPETTATITGGLTDFCALTSGGVRQMCWLADGHLVINGLRQSEGQWSHTWPHLKRAENGVQCLWLESGSLCGVLLSAQRVRLRPVDVANPVPCMLALPGELRKSVVDSRTLMEPVLQPDALGRRQQGSNSPQQYPSGREVVRDGAGDITLSDVVRNQAIYLTRMKESLSALERNMLHMQSEVNRLGKEISVLLRAKEPPAMPERTVRAAAAATVQPPGESLADSPVKAAAAPVADSIETQVVCADETEDTATAENPVDEAEQRTAVADEADVPDNQAQAPDVDREEAEGAGYGGA